MICKKCAGRYEYELRRERLWFWCWWIAKTSYENIPCGKPGLTGTRLRRSYKVLDSVQFPPLPRPALKAFHFQLSELESLCILLRIWVNLLAGGEIRFRRHRSNCERNFADRTRQRRSGQIRCFGRLPPVQRLRPPMDPFQAKLVAAATGSTLTALTSELAVASNNLLLLMSFQ